MNVYLKKQNFFFQRTLLKIGVVVVAVVAINLFQAQTKNVFYHTSAPVSAALWTAGNGISRVFEPFVNIKKLQNDNTALQAENQKLVSQLFNLTQHTLDQQEHDRAAQNAATQHLSIVSAKITGLNTANDTATLTKGSADGVRENMAVVSSENILYGKVAKVYPNASEIMLVSNTQSVVDVKAVNTDSENFVYGAVKGLGNAGFFLDLVDSNAHIQEGQALVTSGLDGIFPAGILVGSIAKVTQNDVKPFQTATVKTLLNPSSIENVFIVTK